MPDVYFTHDTLTVVSILQVGIDRISCKVIQIMNIHLIEPFDTMQTTVITELLEPKIC